MFFVGHKSRQYLYLLIKSLIRPKTLVYGPAVWQLRSSSIDCRQCLV